MSFTKRQNEFCDIPGFDASKGERIVRAFQKLWAKIQYLEQNRTKARSEASCSSKDEDLTLTDVQYKLLLLQLQYVRSLLKRNFNPNVEIFQTKINEDEQQSTSTKKGEKSTSGDKVLLEIVNKPSSEEIYTDNLAAHINSAKKSSTNTENKSKNLQITSEFPRFRHSTKESTAVYQNTVPSSSKPHYHLKLDDVPFILGASSAASHSVVANLQNIMARMKLHNKALCGPKPNATRSNFNNAHSINVTEKPSEENPKHDVTRSNVADLHSCDFPEIKFGENSQDATKMLNVLTRDLSALVERQKKLVESIDTSHITSHVPEMSVARSVHNHANNINYVYIKNDGLKTQRSHSDSEVKLHAEVKKVEKEKVLVKQNLQIKQSAPNIRSQPTFLTTMDRRKLLRSLQNFNRQLSEEDISWN